MGDELFLLAMLELDAGQPARQGLELEDLTANRLLEEIRARSDGSAERPDGLTFSPACYTVQGRAQGFAAALGDGAMTPEHVLLALLWDPQSTSSQLLWRLGVERIRVLDHLRDLGVAVPSAVLPPQREIEWGEQVWFDRDEVRRVLDHVRLHLSPDTRWGFNYGDDRAWVRAEASVDLTALVDGALTAD
ncbi:MAG: Clp protease N-terminal domain-containing protein [Actinomycetota bacterium]|nr:Clp protease N-terminal domain-containing protein [Actinomycetota bacterium]